MSVPAEVIAEALAKHRFREPERICSCGVLCGVVCDGLTYAEHLASVIAALPDIEIVPAGTSTAMGAFAAGSITKQRVLEDIAYVLTGWRYEEPEDTWASVAAVARERGNGALVADVERSYATAGGES